MWAPGTGVETEAQRKCTVQKHRPPGLRSIAGPAWLGLSPQAPGKLLVGLPLLTGRLPVKTSGVFPSVPPPCPVFPASYTHTDHFLPWK